MGFEFLNCALHFFVFVGWLGELLDAEMCQCQSQIREAAAADSRQTSVSQIHDTLSALDL